MRKLLCFAFLFLSAFAYGQTVTVSGHTITGQNGTSSSGISILWELTNDNGQQCKVAGTGLLTPMSFSVTQAQLAAGIAMFPNSSITCGTTLGASRWRYTIKANGVGTRQCSLNITGTTNLDSTACLNATSTPVTVTPTDSLYCRIDGTNCGFTGPITGTSATYTGNVSVGGTLGAAQIENFMSIFGAKCDGATDDSAAWTAAMTKTAALGGLKLIFPVGKTCFFASTITINEPNVDLDCAGGWSSAEQPNAATPTCKLLFASGNNVTGIDMASTPNANIATSIRIRNLNIAGQAVGTGTGNGIHLTTNAGWIERVRVTGFGSCGISVDSSGTGANPNFWRLIQNYSVLNKGDGYCFNGNTNGNTNVGVAEQNTADTNGGWGFNLLATGSTRPSTNQFRANHCISNTSGCFNVNGSSNVLLNNYAEGGGGNGMTLAAGSAGTYVLNALFGGMPITDLGSGNTVQSLNCGATLGTVNNSPCISNQVNIAPVPGSASTKVFSWAVGRQSTDSFDLSDIVNGKLYINFTSGTTPIWFFQNAVNLWLAEGTCAGANAGVSELCADAATHRFALSNNGVARSPIAVFSDNLGNFASGGTITPALQASATNCSAVGTAASPSVASCAAASAGQFSCATNATGATCQVNTTAVTANSEIIVQESDTALTGTRLSVTCNTGTNVLPASRLLASSVAGASFTINLGTVTTNPACFSYHIIN